MLRKETFAIICPKATVMLCQDIVDTSSLMAHIEVKDQRHRRRLVNGAARCDQGLADTFMQLLHFGTVA
jgi:hypothetical protein